MLWMWKLPARVACAIATLPLTLLLAEGAPGAALVGDLDGDGSIGVSDEAWLAGLYGSTQGDGAYDPAADGNWDGRIDHLDLARFGAAWGSTGGDPDTAPPGLFVTLNGVPDDQNDLLVAPPHGFQVTFAFDSDGGSVVDPASFSLTWSEPFGGAPAGTEIGLLVAASPTGGVLEVPTSIELARTSHYVTASIRDAAGNEAQTTYGFAVRDFGFGPPLGTLQTVFVDFDQDRSLGVEIDFLEDLRSYGLSSPAAPAVESQVRDRLVADILARAHAAYGREPDGSPGPDPVNLVFTPAAPVGTHARLCVGGTSPSGAHVLGLAVTDVENLIDNEDTCASAQYGVFPQAIAVLWGASASFQTVFGPVDPALGGTPIGEHPDDAAILGPAFDPAQATSQAVLRWLDVESALDHFALVVGGAVAHETGHLVGLTAPGPTPAGLFGGTYGGKAGHNVTPSGATPPENWIMNAGGSFTFDEMTGRAGYPLPAFRALNWAYLHDRIALNQQVTALYPAPTVTQLDPAPVVFPAGVSSVPVTVSGTGFLETPYVHMRGGGSPTWKSLSAVTFVSPTTLTAAVNAYVFLPGTYELRVTNPDGQVATLEDPVLVVQQ